MNAAIYQKRIIQIIGGLMIALVAMIGLTNPVWAEDTAPRTTVQENGAEVVRFDYKSSDVNVLVTLTNASDLPDNAVMSVTPVSLDNQEKGKVEEKAKEESKDVKSTKAYDIKFTVDGKEVEPGATVKVAVTTPQVQAGEKAAVYHVSDDKNSVDNMDANTSDQGQVDFNTNHFSRYVIINYSPNPVNVTIQRYYYSDGDSTNTADSNLQMIYKSSKTIKAQEDGKTYQLSGVDYNQDNYTFVKATKTTTVNGEQKTEDFSPSDLVVTGDTTISVYYTRAEATKSGDTTFYDYSIQKGINQAANYSNYTNNREETSAKKNARIAIHSSWTGTNVYSPLNGTAQSINGYDGGHDRDLYSIKQGIVVGTDSSGAVVYGKNTSGTTLSDPGLFTTDTKSGKTIMDDYQLTFKQTGDDYHLSTVNCKDTTHNTQVQNAGSNFLPLNNDTRKLTENNNNSGTDFYFGMRYDVDFTLGDYVGPLNYSFTGDDDLWVILDGKTVLDMGGIHGAVKGSVNLWTGDATYTGYQSHSTVESGTKTLSGEDGLYDLLGITDPSQLTDAQKSQKHTITILYMERGAGESNCNMNFTLPNAKVTEVTQVPKGDLTFNKVGKVETTDAGTPLADATFTIAKKDTPDAIIATATSDDSGTVTFPNLEVGEYVVKEETAPTGYACANQTFYVQVTLNEDGTTATAKMYSDEKYTQEVTQVDNYEINSHLLQQKTAHVTDWDNRIYQIDLYTSQTVPVLKEISGATIVDTIDSRFDVVDKDGNQLADGTAVDGGTLKYNEAGEAYIIWGSQVIPGNNDVTQGWHKTLYVKAKADYIGGNNVPTNVESKSGITVSGITKNFDNPKVNVKARFAMSNVTKTVFLGDTVDNQDSQNAMLTTAGIKDMIGGSYQSITAAADKLATQWFTKEAMGSGDQTTVNQMPANPTEEETVWYLKATYNLGQATEESTKNTTINNKGYISGDATANGVDSFVTGSNDDQMVRNGVTTTSEPSVKGKEYGVYTVHVVRGQLMITKTIDNQYSTIRKINANQTFVFKVERYDMDAKGEKVGDTPTDTFYETINFDANAGTTTSSKLISNLKAGFYTVTEETKWSPKYVIDGSTPVSQSYSIGIVQSTDDKGVRTFNGLEDMNKNLKATNKYGKVAEGKHCTTTYMNKRTDWNWLSDTAAAVNEFVK